MTKTPADLTILRRNYEFGREEAHPRWWHGGDPVATAFYNALSATFPLGERFFMDAVKAYRKVGSPRLQQQVADFLYQEAVHSREHVVFNKMARDAGYPMQKLEDRTAIPLGWARKRTPLEQLAVTTALEHFTAMLAAAVLSDRRHFAAAPKEAQEMWLWHAMEEVEHKSVAFDVLLAATRKWPGVLVWALRCAVMFFSTIILFAFVGAHIATLFKEDGINDARHWRRLFRFMFGKGGILRAITPSYFRYYKPGFHPWEEDDTAILDVVRRELVRGEPAAA